MHHLVEKLSYTERAAVAALKALLVQQYGVQDIRLFGSKARGTGHAESDLDLFIVVPDLDWECAKAIYTLCFELSLRYDLLIAPTLCSQAEIEDPSLGDAVPPGHTGRGSACMSEEQAALVRYRLDEAKETLEEARLLARESRW
jgi:uncharacterized protein